jgi:hypothetical protein
MSNGKAQMTNQKAKSKRQKAKMSNDQIQMTNDQVQWTNDGWERGMSRVCFFPIRNPQSAIRNLETGNGELADRQTGKPEDRRNG